MRIALYSDLHLEEVPHRRGTLAWEPPPLDVDVVILAGDIGSQTSGIQWAAAAFRQWPAVPEIIYVAGNHEYYGAHIRRLTAELRSTAARLGIHFLEKDAIEIGGVRFLGATLWTDFQLYGSGESAANSQAVAKRRIDDYSTIFAAGKRFIEPSDMIRLNMAACKFLARELEKPCDGKTVVVTHFAPHSGCVPKRFEGDALAPYLAVDMTSLMRKHSITLWAFGHTHYNVDFVADGCRILSNQCGYLARRCHDFRENLVIEL